MTQPESDPRVVQLVLDRAGDPEAFEAWANRAKMTGWCRHPVRLVGATRTVDADTGELLRTFTSAELPDRTLLKACGQRRATVCPSCSATYRTDAFHLVAAGLRGGKGIPETVAEHPVVFATLTAPSFGSVHSRRIDKGLPRPCHPSETDCGHRRVCLIVHPIRDPKLGQPICRDCFDSQAAVLWNALASELWRRTTIGIRRSLAKAVGITATALRQEVRLSFTKVVEYQNRGAIHVHAVIRLDGSEPDTEPPEAYTTTLLAEAIWAAAHSARAPYPAVGGVSGDVRWGKQLDIHPITGPNAPPGAVAAYLAKYATKSTEPEGLLDRRLRVGDLERLDKVLNPHLARMVRTAWDLGGHTDLQALRLRAWAHTLGFRGHWLTKSRAYSTTFTALRAARRDWQLGTTGKDAAPLTDVGDWTFAGRGWFSPADAWLAESAATESANARRAAWEER